MSWLPMTVSSEMDALTSKLPGADLLLNEVLRGDRFKGLLPLPAGEVGEDGEVLESFIESGESRTVASCQLLIWRELVHAR